MEKNSKQKEEFARRLAEDEKEKGLKINQRAYKFNFNSDKAKITYAKQRIVFE